MILREYLQSKDVRFDVIPHMEERAALGHAHACGIAEEAYAKTVLCVADHGYRDVVAVVPANRRLDLEALSRALGGAHVRLAKHAEVAAHCPDCQRGVLPPFGSHYQLLTILDASLAVQPRMAFEGNSHSETITLPTDDFIRLESPLVATISTAPPPR